ncbi:MAG: bifunctional pyr operon transcriptional regulator/uracil phosphoribosyltransferase PyrR [Oscillospiraceae bacterium]|nr:bifunctional pyr operon transcriptional regulator/uracil phosphoribosyltransferase PyrR [Oscillospiraceae bacterium]
MVKLSEKAELMDKNTANRIISRMCDEILEHNGNTENLVFIGIQKKGALIAKLIAKRIKETEGEDIPVGSMDITFYRDDLTLMHEQPVINGNDIPFSIHKKDIVLVDDVLYSGRTIRAAIDELFDMGRPDSVQLAIMIDRCQRQLPISADYIGKEVPVSKSENINVEIDDDGSVRRVALCDIKTEK